MIKLIVPRMEELSFRKELLSDEDTMSYNHKWGGTIDFQENKWEEWYRKWIINKNNDRYYAYLFSEKLNCYVGEIAYHYSEKEYIANIIIHSKYRGNGFGKIGLKLLCKKAKENGLVTLFDNIALGNPSIKMFLDYDFKEVWRNEEAIMIKKDL
ncbi:GNAT family N-acetyltransferase [Clostridium nigeriense]|uniref:GNAT family N-acetyltransferase n=1 Tax=Clostridium nigeriense TaxID=1805470 RepID=UPI003D342AAA